MAPSSSFFIVKTSNTCSSGFATCTVGDDEEDDADEADDGDETPEVSRVGRMLRADLSYEFISVGIEKPCVDALCAETYTHSTRD